MDDRLSSLEATVRRLEHTLADVEARLAAVEHQRALALPPVESAAASIDDEPAATPDVRREGLVTILSYIGRTLVALGGAYLLRALTDSRMLPEAAGIALGLVYALSWLVFADLAGRSDLAMASTSGTDTPRPAFPLGQANAAFHGVVFAVIAFPLLWEATVRFKYLGPDATGVVLTLVTAAALGVALHARLHALAWIVTLAALPSALALVAATGVVVPFALFLVLLGVATLWLGYNPLYWKLLRWPVALVVDMTVLAIALRAAGRGWSDAPLPAISVQLLLLSGYLGSIAVRTLVRGRDVIPFEVVQTIAALAVGFGGAVYVATITGYGVAPLALVNLAFGAVCYAVAFVFIAQRQGLRRNFHFYTSLGLILVVVSSRLLLDDAALALVCAALALVCTWSAVRVGQVSLAMHGAVYVIVGAGVSGLLAAAGSTLVGSAATAWPPFPPAALIMLATAGACWVLPPVRDRLAHVPRLLVLLALVWSAGGVLVGLVTPVLSGVPGAGADAGVLATIRTTVLALAAIALAWTARSERFRESAWLLYPVLVAGGLKLLVEDLPQSRPATLFIALALYGSALIAAPRLVHRRV